MSKLDIKQKLLDRSDQFESKGLAWVLITLVLVLMSVAVMYFSRNTNSNNMAALTNLPSSRPARLYSVFYDGGVFSPTNLRIHVGDAVKFQNSRTAAAIWVISDPHPIHNGLAGLNSGELSVKGYFTYTFNLPGIFGYHNEKNPNETGSIIVRQ